MRVTPIIAFADWLGIAPKATKIFAYNNLDVVTKLFSFWVRSRFNNTKTGQILGNSVVAVGTGAMVMSLGQNGDTLYDVNRKPGKHVKKGDDEDRTTKRVPSLWDRIVTLNGFLAARGMGHALMASVITIAFCLANIASGMPMFNGQDKDGKPLDKNAPPVATGPRIAMVGAVLGAALAANENLDVIYHKVVPKTPDEMEVQRQEEQAEQKAAAG